MLSQPSPILRISFIVLAILHIVHCQEDPPSFFFNCSRYLVLTPNDQNGNLSFFDLETLENGNNTAISSAPDVIGRIYAAFDEHSGLLYINEIAFLIDDGFFVQFTQYSRLNATDPSFPAASPFVLDPTDDDVGDVRGLDFVDGDMYFVTGRPPFDEPNTVVKARVNENPNDEGKATLAVLNNSVAVGDFATLAWDECKSVMYSTNSSGQFFVIHIDTGVVDPRGITVVEGGVPVTFTDITVGPNCILYGVVDGGDFDNFVSIIDTETLNVTPLARAQEFFDPVGIASCAKPPPPPPTPAPTPMPTPLIPTSPKPTPHLVAMPTTDKCFVDPIHSFSETYESKSYLEGRYYHVRDICAYPKEGIKVCCHTDDYKKTSGDGPNCVSCDQCSTPQEVNDHCCAWAWWDYGKDNHHHLPQWDGMYKGSKTKGQSKGSKTKGSSKGSKTKSRSTSSKGSYDNNDMYYGGCKSMFGEHYVCCKCDDGYTCAKEGVGCTTACLQKE